MIPSRALDIGGIINETLRIVKKLFTRAILISFICLIPGLLICLAATDNISSSLERFSKQYIEATPEAPILFRNYLALAVSNEPGLAYYRLQYPDIFHALDSVKEALIFQDSAATKDTYANQLDSIRLLVKARSGISASASFLDAVTPGLWLLGIGVLVLILGALARAAMLLDLSCRVFEERPLPLATVLKAAFGRSMWLLAVQYLLIFLAMLFGMGIVVGITVAVSTVLGALGVFASLIIVTYALFRLIFSSVALVSEELHPLAAIKRSLQLTEGYFWRIVGITLIVGLMILTISWILGVPLTFIATVPEEFIIHYIRTGVGFESIFGEFSGYIRTMIIFSFATGLLTATFTPAFSTTFYYDMRTRVDGPLEYDTPSEPTDTPQNPPEILTA
ncbi:MAG TPA: hypothetical protein VFO76_09365 [Candidatus Kapabacteria bacterium]|nr:hypothetical protein [Candidatus Kapabacteria bacterium]